MGNGKATAILFAREGAAVLCVDVDAAAAEATRDTILKEGGRAEAFAADVTRSADCQAAIASCIEHFQCIDVLHNNVGVGDGKEIIDVTEDDWYRAFDRNVKAMYLMCKFAIPHMIEGGGGSIINVSSIASVRPMSGMTYTTTKGAVNTLTIYLARRYGQYNIRSNCVMLGYMDTPLVAPVWKDERVRDTNLKQVPMRRFGSPWEGVKVAAFLASDDASYVNGAIIPVDGGLILRI